MISDRPSWWPARSLSFVALSLPSGAGLAPGLFRSSRAKKPPPGRSLATLVTCFVTCFQTLGSRALRCAGEACDIRLPIGSHLRLIRRFDAPGGDRPRVLVHCEPFWR